MKAGEPFDWERINFVLELRGTTVENFVAESQDKSRSALAKSLEAAFLAWEEQLKGDQAMFDAEAIRSERESAKNRAKLVKQLEECHDRAWRTVQGFMEKNMQIFQARSVQADSTIMPQVFSWIDGTIDENDTKTDPDTKDEEKIKRDDEEGDQDAEDAEVCDVRYQLEKALGLKERGLRVRPITWVFDPATVYGSRDGCLSGLACISKDATNIFKSSKAMKSGVVHDVHMLPRTEFYKPPASSPTKSSLPHLGRALTDIQEWKQVAAGTDIVKKSLAAFTVPTVATTIVVDGMAYDGFPALAALEEICEGKTLISASVMLDKPAEELGARLSNQIYESCRAGRLELQNFPNFEPTIAALKAGSARRECGDYKVCRQQGTKLVVLESLASKFLETETLADRASDLIKAHNKTYNPDGDFMASERTEATEVRERPTKRIKLEPTAERLTKTDLQKLEDPQFVFKLFTLELAPLSKQEVRIFRNS
ncbi:unnamed protein product [Cladocopium goreaui]|uniref:Uncharacterized protein n=1 Tax=Cladocopium goreaui TaxID=2562237 RepID=A0A9P1CR93_9DINO|nr:unnamed protein product [Cladocopium goreaui]CAI4013043.1 unnamed protein product [Cladocopium goreaui]